MLVEMLFLIIILFYGVIGMTRGCMQSLVTGYFTTNPDARQADCVQDTGISAATVSKYWPDKRNRYRDRVLMYCNEHPDASKIQCKRDTGLSLFCIAKHWPKEARSRHINAKELVEQFFHKNPDAQQKECVITTGVNATTVSKYWPRRKKISSMARGLAEDTCNNKTCLLPTQNEAVANAFDGTVQKYYQMQMVQCRLKDEIIICSSDYMSDECKMCSYFNECEIKSCGESKHHVHKSIPVICENGSCIKKSPAV